MEIVIALLVIAVIGYWMWSANSPSIKTQNEKINDEAPIAPVAEIAPVVAAPAKKAPAKKPAAKPAVKKAPAKPAARKPAARTVAKKPAGKKK